MVNNSSLVDPVLPIHSQLQPNIQKLNLMIRYWPVNIKSIIDFEKTTVYVPAGHPSKYCASTSWDRGNLFSIW